MGSGFKALVAALISTASLAANAIATDWTVVNLTPEGMGQAVAISQNGIVTGCRNTTGNTTVAFIYTNGSRRDLAVPAGSATSCGAAVNNNGFVAGRIDGQMVLWSPDGTTRALGVPGDVTGISEGNVVVGYMGADYASRRAMMWSNGIATDLGVTGTAIGINSRNQIAIQGTDGQLYMWEGGVVRKLGDQAVTIAKAFNDRGEIVGMGSFGHGPEPFIYDGSTVRQIAGAGSYASAVSINNVGQVLGSGEGVYGYLIEGGSSVRLDVLANAGGATLLHHAEGQAINDRGWIVGRNGTVSFNAFLMIPKEASTPAANPPSANMAMRASARSQPLIRARNRSQP